jgi:hypothetical protein
MFWWLLFISGCPWGDEYTDCTMSHCIDDFSKCCQTCTPTTTAIYTTTTAKSSRVQVSPALLFCLFLYQFYSGIMSICWYIYFNCTLSSTIGTFLMHFFAEIFTVQHADTFLSFIFYCYFTFSRHATFNTDLSKKETWT